MKVTDFLGVKVTYDEDGQFIWAVDKDAGLQKIADVRAWGAIQNLFKNADGTIDLKKASEFQDELGKWIVDCINEKLQPTVKTPGVKDNFHNRHTHPLPAKRTLITIIVLEQQKEVKYLCEWNPFDPSSYPPNDLPAEGYLGTAKVIEGTYKGIGFNVWKQNNSEFIYYQLLN